MKTEPEKKKGFRKRTALLLIMMFSALVFCAAYFARIPLNNELTAGVKTLAEGELSKIVDTPVTIESLAISLHHGLILKNISAVSLDGEEVTVEEIRVDFEEMDLFRGRLVVEDVVIMRPIFSIRRIDRAEVRFPFAFEGGSENSSTLEFLKIQDARIAYYGIGQTEPVILEEVTGRLYLDEDPFFLRFSARVEGVDGARVSFRGTIDDFRLDLSRIPSHLLQELRDAEDFFGVPVVTDAQVSFRGESLKVDLRMNSVVEGRRRGTVFSLSGAVDQDEDDFFHLEDTEISLLGMTIVCTGRLNQTEMDVSFDGAGDLEAMIELLPALKDIDVRGAVELKGRLQGTWEQPQFAGSVLLKDGRLWGARSNRLSGRMAFSPALISISDLQGDLAGGRASDSLCDVNLENGNRRIKLNLQSVDASILNRLPDLGGALTGTLDLICDIRSSAPAPFGVVGNVSLVLTEGRLRGFSGLKELAESSGVEDWSDPDYKIIRCGIRLDRSGLAVESFFFDLESLRCEGDARADAQKRLDGSLRALVREDAARRIGDLWSKRSFLSREGGFYALNYHIEGTLDEPQFVLQTPGVGGFLRGLGGMLVPSLSEGVVRESAEGVGGVIRFLNPFRRGRSTGESSSSSGEDPAGQGGSPPPDDPHPAPYGGRE